jgi:hypothetical protein
MDTKNYVLKYTSYQLQSFYFNNKEAQYYDTVQNVLQLCAL